MNQCREETSIYRLVKAVTPLNALHKSLGNKEINALFQSLGTVVAIGVAIFLPRVPYAAASRPSGWTTASTAPSSWLVQKEKRHSEKELT